MGGSSDPIAKAWEDTKKTVTKGIKDIGNTGEDLVNDGVNTAVYLVDDAAQSSEKYIRDGYNTINQTGDDILSEVARWDRSGIHLDPGVKDKQSAKDQDKQRQRDQDAALRNQEQARQDQLKQSAANKDATRGSSIILGGKKKKKGKGSVSNGLGLSTGDTGLQT